VIPTDPLPEKHAFLDRCCLVDIETGEQGAIYALGAVFQGRRFLVQPPQRVQMAQLAELDAFAGKAEFVLGHNILAHDLPRLRQQAPELRLLRKPVVDTLILSPLAFPENPYHRLVKNYQIVRDSINDPAEDAALAARVFAEQWLAFTAQLAQGSDALLVYRGLFARDADYAGIADALGAMGVPLLKGDDLVDVFAWLVQDAVCREPLNRLVDQLIDGQASSVPLAYVTAWLTVADGNSVLPPWVRHQFPEVAPLLHQLREQPCDNPACRYCSRHHDPRRFLRQFFGFDDFRPQPANSEGASLQQLIVGAAARNHSLFATLPTGGGKSLCYQLPALMRYQRRNVLTIVISPLQALMKDQVDNFSRQTGTNIAAALYGLLTLPERGALQERIRLGDIGILYVSPEQLRNASFVRLIAQREIGAWVFDEAHCLSKWGHDFRPDYLYAIRFIREFAQKEHTRIPPVQCFTATAKRDVRQEILDIIQSELGLRVDLFTGGHERTNLHYEVWPVSPHEKQQVILGLLRERFHPPGSVVIYCATRKHTEQLAEFLQAEGLEVEAFHAGLEPSLKKRIQDAFVSGAVPIICATNAFGMGIDKEDVRLVIHADIPGSLENYLQEAGRAGRDREAAECILIFTEQDIEGQFRLSSSSRLCQRDIAQLLRGIKKMARNRKRDEVVLTTGELVRSEAVDTDLEQLYDYDTRVKTAVAWLERGGFLSRNENNTTVFQGRVLVRNLEEAAAHIKRLNLSQRQQERWFDILASLMNKPVNEGFSADELAASHSFAATSDDPPLETETRRVIRTLHDMAEQGLLTKETTLSAYLRYKVRDSSEKKLQLICALEKNFLTLLRQTATETEVETELHLDLRRVNQQLIDEGHADSSPEALKKILYGLSRDGKGLAGRKGSLSVRARGSNSFTLVLHRDWPALDATVSIRQQAAHTALQTIIAAIDPAAPAGTNLLVAFTLEQLVAALKTDLLLLPNLKDPLAAAERALSFMHEQGIIELQQGLAVFNQAMTLSLYPQSKGRTYTKNDFAPLATHYGERTFQIHVMNEYARCALEKISAAMHLVSSYFNDEKEEFLRRFFPQRKDILERPTSEQSFQRIVEDLHNPEQERIVTAPADSNLLVLAGPGSGKTRVVAHRVAWLLRVQRVRASAILVLCFNRAAVLSLRQRMRDLVGNDMAGVTTLTFHGLALRLIGRSLVRTGGTRDETIDFDEIIRDAIALLKGEREVIGLATEEAREILMARYSHILVDEYQDIDAEQYEMVSLLAGRTLKEGETKLSILAVGDDDQNIYRFRGTNVDFIRRFHQDYGAAIHYLVENYRSSGNIIAAADTLIAHNSDRMKTGHPIRINRARRSLPAGGNWQSLDPFVRGRVQVLKVANAEQQALILVDELQRLQRLSEHWDMNRCAVFARTWQELDAVRSVCSAAGIPVCLNWNRGTFPGLHRIRESALLLDQLRARRGEMLAGADLAALLSADPSGETIWLANLRRLLTDWIEETGGLPQPAHRIEEYIFESLVEQRQARSLGDGLLLATVHAAKGLEFDHVFVLGGWQSRERDETVAVEEERRLYYVALSRARETLQLFAFKGRGNPHTAKLSGEGIITRTPVLAAGTPVALSTYTLLGMKDLYIDYAGTLSEQHRERKAIAELQAEDLVELRAEGDHIFLVHREERVGRLSKSAAARWRPFLYRVTEIRVVAMARRYRTDIDDAAFQRRCHGEQWEFPLVELRWSAAGKGAAP
jgi:ATP-dependent DNA helicase RecQ